MTGDLKRLTYQEYLDLPEMKARYSIIDGELVMAAAPTTEHQRAILELALKLTPFTRERRLGEAFIAPSILSFGVIPCVPGSPTCYSSAMLDAILSDSKSLRVAQTSLSKSCHHRTPVKSYRKSCRIIKR